MFYSRDLLDDFLQSSSNSNSEKLKIQVSPISELKLVTAVMFNLVTKWKVN